MVTFWGTQTVRDDLRSGRFPFYRVRKQFMDAFGLLPDGQKCVIPYAINANIWAIFTKRDK